MFFFRVYLHLLRLFCAKKKLFSQVNRFIKLNVLYNTIQYRTFSELMFSGRHLPVMVRHRGGQRLNLLKRNPPQRLLMKNRRTVRLMMRRLLDTPRRRRRPVLRMQRLVRTSTGSLSRYLSSINATWRPPRRTKVQVRDVGHPILPVDLVIRKLVLRCCIDK